MPATKTLTPAAYRFIKSARVARLATADADAQPHAIPVCFAVVDGAIYIGLDAKPKSVNVLRLRRVRNMTANPQASLIVDRYDEDWTKLGYVLISATATLDIEEPERASPPSAPSSASTPNTKPCCPTTPPSSS